MGNLSPHFSQSEFDCRHCGAIILPPPLLVAVLERIRAITGQPLEVVSGFRCEAHNARVGGARMSQHLRGTAADIPAGRASLHQAQKAGAVGVGLKGVWAIHVDVRKGPPAHWRY